MNGAELPCGSVLHVEPADPQYKQNKSERSYGPSSGDTMKEESEAPAIKEAVDGGNDKDNSPADDLDDFFDSL